VHVLHGPTRELANTESVYAQYIQLTLIPYSLSLKISKLENIFQS